MNHFHYAYVQQSLSNPNEIYTGITANLKKRLVERNAGRVAHTSKFTPWEIWTVAAFKSNKPVQPVQAHSALANPLASRLALTGFGGRVVSCPSAHL
jgi:hypothetical protein